MKKTVIIAIFIVYLASIVMVQLFAIPPSVPEGGAYVENLEITGVEIVNREEGDTQVRAMTNAQTGEIWYWFYFVPCTDGEYTRDEASLASNPNRIRINFDLTPDDATKEYLAYVLNNDNVVHITGTSELVFLKRVSVTVEVKESKGNLNASDSVTIRTQ